MNRSPAVSVIVAAYNSGAFLRPTLESVQRQSFQDFELIVVDDGSTDGAPELLERIRDPRLRVIRQANQGQAAALNAGGRVARGACVAFLDHDDLWTDNKLARHLEFMAAHPAVDLTFSWSRFIDEDGKPLSLHTRHWRGCVSFSQLLADFVIGNTSSVVGRREALDRVGWFDPNLRRCFDQDAFLRVALLRPNNVCAIEETLTLYRRHPRQMSRDWRAMRTDWERMLEKLRALAPDEVAAVEGLAAANTHRYLAFLAYENREFLESCRLLWWAFRRRPGGFLADKRNWMAAAGCLAGLLLPDFALSALERRAGVTGAKGQSAE
ncbi:MAG: glycosyltransferase family 2 protein [Acidobacteria bacterium]|nr:glycosyltransferase family 2 protein [Acidobacteriota bacterium]